VRRFLTATVLSAALLASCKGDSPEETSRAPLRPMEITEAVSKAQYDPPADGRLTEEQVEIYIAVKAREREVREAMVREVEAKVGAQREKKPDLAESMRLVGDVVGLTMADLRAALELGHNPKEYTWVKDRVAEAQTAEANEILSKRVDQSRAEYLAMLEDERKGAVTEEQRAEIDRQIQEFQRRSDSAALMTPSVRHNMALLEKYRARMLDAQLGGAAVGPIGR
jgi:hypothetical protein